MNLFSYLFTSGRFLYDIYIVFAHISKRKINGFRVFQIHISKRAFTANLHKDLPIAIHAHAIHLRVQTKAITHVTKQDILVNPLVFELPSSHMLNFIQQYMLLNPSCFQGLVSSNLPLFASYLIMASFSAARAFPSYDTICWKGEINQPKGHTIGFLCT